MATLVESRNLRDVLNLITLIASALTKIDVFEPDRIELCVKTAQPVPHFATEHQEGSRRLLGFSASGKVEVQATIPPIQRITRSQAIDAQDLENQRHRRRKTAGHVAGLHAAAIVPQFSARQSSALARTGGFQRFKRRFQLDIGIQ
jgi:hypothetical protein